MEIRKDEEVEEILEYTKGVWKLTINERDVLESFLYSLKEQNIEELKQIEHLLNGEDFELLQGLNDRVVIDYATEELDLISSEWEDSLVDALEDLNFDFIDKVSDTQMIDYLENDGWTVTMDDYVIERRDIVTNMQIEEMNNLFLSLDLFSREKIINQIKELC
jgi:hypothetical protein